MEQEIGGPQKNMNISKKTSIGTQAHTTKKSVHNADVEPFESAEAAWFWFIAAQQAKLDGARIRAAHSLVKRPCEPTDILNILDRLYRKRRLLRDHLLVLRHYGRRQIAPDARREKEARSAHLWAQALERIQPILERKGIVNAQSWPKPDTQQRGHSLWMSDVIIYENTAHEFTTEEGA